MRTLLKFKALHLAAACAMLMLVACEAKIETEIPGGDTTTTGAYDTTPAVGTVPLDTGVGMTIDTTTLPGTGVTTGTTPGTGTTTGTGATTGGTTAGGTGTGTGTTTPGSTSPGASTTPGTTTGQPGTGTGGQGTTTTTPDVGTPPINNPSTTTTPPASTPPTGGGAAQGVATFTAQKCNTGHAVNSAGIAKTGSINGPDLSNVGSKRTEDWIVGYLKKTNDIAGKKHPKTINSESDIATLADWLATLK